MLRKLATAAVVLLGTTVAASADGYSARYGQACCQFSWTGFYIGANAGVLWDDSSHTLSPSGLFPDRPLTVPTNSLRTRPGDLDATSLTGGVQAGYNYQMGMLVIGVEGDIQQRALACQRHAGGRLAGSAGRDHGASGGREARLVRHAARPRRHHRQRWLIYATGGWAFGHVKSSTFVQFSLDGDTYTSSFSDTVSGWAAGGGFEYAFRDNWT
jgi:outer membrane immunogenic protein